MSNKPKYISNSEFFYINRLNFNFNPVKVFITKVKIYLKESSYIYGQKRPQPPYCDLVRNKMIIT